jgi:hypothetical protein
VTHTPGPWETRLLTNSTRVYAPEFNNAEICSIQRSRFSSGPTTTRREADARLIAAAPELLAALKVLFTAALEFETETSTAERRGNNLKLLLTMEEVNRVIAKAEAVS